MLPEPYNSGSIVVGVPSRIVRAMPPSLRACIDLVVAGTKTSALAARVEQLSATYRAGSAAVVPIVPILSSADDVLAYAAYRMPATFAVARAVLGQLSGVLPGFEPRQLVDLGSGTGAVAWAAVEVLPSLSRLSLLEQSSAAIDVGKNLMQRSDSSVLQGATWRSWRLSDADDVVAGDLATAAYVLGELTELQQVSLLQTLAECAPVVVVIEPGTPAGFGRILNARSYFIELGFTIAAPCPHELTCPMVARNDWCHFAERLERSRVHRVVKDSDLSYEDEKYSYVIAVCSDAMRAEARVLRHPRLRKGLVSLTLCTASGEAVELRVSKSQGLLYKGARRVAWGGPWPPPPDVQ
jgi:ribosomal protein RSM22 (predicted rRNA methylase)